MPVGLVLHSQYPGVAGWAGTRICVEKAKITVDPATIMNTPAAMIRALNLATAMRVKFQDSLSRAIVFLV